MIKSTTKLEDWEMIFAIHTADKRLLFEIKNSHMSKRKRQLKKKMSKGYEQATIKRKPEHGQ